MSWIQLTLFCMSVSIVLLGLCVIMLGLSIRNLTRAIRAQQKLIDHIRRWHK